jgi:hypothetical protein
LTDRVTSFVNQLFKNRHIQAAQCYNASISWRRLIPQAIQPSDAMEWYVDESTRMSDLSSFCTPYFTPYGKTHDAVQGIPVVCQVMYILWFMAHYWCHTEAMIEYIENYLVEFCCYENIFSLFSTCKSTQKGWESLKIQLA